VAAFEKHSTTLAGLLSASTSSVITASSISRAGSRQPCARSAPASVVGEGFAAALSAILCRAMLCPQPEAISLLLDPAAPSELAVRGENPPDDSASVCNDNYRGRRIASPEMLSETELLPHLICSLPVGGGGYFDEAGQHGSAR
jgi:hypothetical protein